MHTDKKENDREPSWSRIPVRNFRVFHIVDQDHETNRRLFNRIVKSNWLFQQNLLLSYDNKPHLTALNKFVDNNLKLKTLSLRVLIKFDSCLVLLYNILLHNTSLNKSPVWHIYDNTVCDKISWHSGS